MIKTLWYLIGLSTIFLIILYNPSNTSNSVLSSNRIFRVNNGQGLLIKFIVFSIIIFFILTIISVNLIYN